MAVAREVMESVYQAARTPHKYGIIVKGDSGESVDCPSVFRHGGRWYMMYVATDELKTGYETYLAVSDDLLAWTKLGKILAFSKLGWDAWQADGGIALQDTTWGGSCELGAFDGKYWLSYIGGAKKGYEPDPLSMGLAWTTAPDQATEWNRLADNPILSPDQPDARTFEQRTLYKSNIFRDAARTLGHEFVMFYNGKETSGTERIGMAVSDDMVHWSRFGDGPVIDNSHTAPSESSEATSGRGGFKGISGDPQIVRMGDVWVMFYFGAFWKPSVPKAFDTFACSDDLVNWTKWEGEHLIAPSEPWDETFAHKPWLVKWAGAAYHFYCAVGDQGRTIAVATSKPMR